MRGRNRLSVASLGPACSLCLGPSLDNPGGRINDDEWISDVTRGGGGVVPLLQQAADALGQLSVQLATDDRHSAGLHGLELKHMSRIQAHHAQTWAGPRSEVTYM